MGGFSVGSDLDCDTPGRLTANMYLHSFLSTGCDVSH